jgi:hypothetical protein
MDIAQMPERIAYLILLYLHGKLTLLGRKEIDAWIAESEQHAGIFEEAVNFDPDSM